LKNLVFWGHLGWAFSFLGSISLNNVAINHLFLAILATGGSPVHRCTTRFCGHREHPTHHHCRHDCPSCPIPLTTRRVTLVIHS
jgi:hypothetical protein